MQLSFVLIFRHTNIYTYTYVYMHTPIHTCRDVDLSVKQKDSFILLKDLCLTCFFFVLLSLIFTNRIPQNTAMLTATLCTVM